MAGWVESEFVVTLRSKPLKRRLNICPLPVEISSKMCQQRCQQTSWVKSKMELRKVGWSYP